jgi:hypothetical protein
MQVFRYVAVLLQIQIIRGRTHKKNFVGLTVNIDKKFHMFGYKIDKEYPHDLDTFIHVCKDSVLRLMPIMCSW